MRLSAALKVRFARGTARDGQWCEINHRPVDWASRSLTREFERVIMVDVLIGEMVGSDRSPPERLQRAFGAECQRSSTRPKWRCSQRRSGRVATTELTEPTLLEIARQPPEALHGAGTSPARKTRASTQRSWELCALDITALD